MGARQGQTADHRRNDRDALDLALIPLFGDVKVTAIDTDACAKFVRGLETAGLHSIDPKRPKRPLSESGVKRYTKPLSGALDLAVRRGLIQSNPYKALTSDEKPRKREAAPAVEWSDEQIEQLLSAAKRVAAKKTSQYDYTPLLRFACETGERLGECLGSDWGDIDLDEGVAYVRKQFTLTGELSAPKTRSGVRRIPLAKSTVAWLRAYKLSCKFSRDEHPVFASLTGGRLSHRNVQTRGFERARDEAGLDETLSFHSMRHAFASRCASRGVPITTLSEILGHANVAITMRIYVGFYDRQKAEDGFRALMADA